MPNEPSHPVVDIKDALADFISAESELAAAELKPAAKSAGIGAAMFAGAAVFLFHAIWMLVIVLALAVGLLLYSLTPLGPWGSFTLGFLVSMLLSGLFAFILITLGRGKFREVKKPTATIAEAKTTLNAVVDAITARPSANPPTLDEVRSPSVDRPAGSTSGRLAP